jgi:hypothetical protein
VSISSVIRWDAVRRATGELRAETAGRRHAVSADRGAARGCHRGARGGTRSQPRGTSDPACDARRGDVDLAAVAVLRAPRADAQETTGYAVEQDRPDILKAREAWAATQRDVDPARLVVIDATWTAKNMTRTHGRCARGERLRMGFPHGTRTRRRSSPVSGSTAWLHRWSSTARSTATGSRSASDVARQSLQRERRSRN